MGNFIRNWLIKIANTAILFGVLLACYGAYKAFVERGVSNTSTAMEIAEVGSQNELIYANVSGGQLDLGNTMKSELQSRKRGTTYSTNYFIPVKNDGGEVSYILQTSDDPLGIAAGTANFTGLLQNADALSGDLKETFKQMYAGQKFHHLDTTYKPESMGKKFGMVGAFLGLAIGAFFVRRFLIGGSRRNEFA